MTGKSKEKLWGFRLVALSGLIGSLIMLLVTGILLETLASIQYDAEASRHKGRIAVYMIGIGGTTGIWVVTIRFLSGLIPRDASQENSSCPKP